MQKKLRVLIIQPWISWRGAEKISVQLAIELKKQGHRVKIAALFIDDKKNLSLGAERVSYLLPAKLLRVFCQRSKLFLLLVGPIVLFLLVWKESKDYQILNPHNLPSPWIAVLVGKIKKIPVVWTVHNLSRRVSWQDKTSIFEYLLWFFGSSWVDKFFIRQVDGVIASSLRMKRQIKERYGLDSKIIHPGVDFNFFSQGEAEKAVKRWRLEGKFILLSARQLHPEKNQIILIRALPKLRSKIVNVLLVLAGEGPAKGDYGEEAKGLKVADRVLVTGFLSPRDLRDLYAASDINLVPSLEEPWGLTPFEAACARTISVVSENSGAAEVIQREKIGATCQPTMKDFTEKILAIYRNQEKFGKIAEKGNLWVKKNLSWSNYAARTIKTVGSVLGGGSA